MDIYILRDGKETGPFSEATTHTLLQQGSIAETDFAWHAGLPKWIALADVLHPPAPALETPPPPPPAADEIPAVVPAPVADLPKAGESATEKQKALLGYLGIPFSAELSKDHAALLVNDAMEDAKNGPRLVQWNTDRLKLHPDLFAAELQVKKEARASEFFAHCAGEGAEYFTKITKAHCQVLVGYLDVKFPNWDEHRDAAKKYFFPAVAEKFPQLVAKPWKGKLRYASGAKIAAEIGRQRPAGGKVRRRASSSTGPLAAITRGLVFGAIILAMFFFVQKVLNAGGTKSSAAPDKAATGQTENPTPKLAPPPSPVKPEALPPIAPEKMAAQAEPANPAIAALPGDPLMADPANPSAVVAASPLDPKMAALPGDPEMAAAPAAPAPAPAPKSALPLNGFPPDPPLTGGSLFDPAKPAAPATPAPAPAVAPTAPPADPTAAARPNLKITKQFEVQFAYGKVKLPVGTSVKFVAREGSNVRVNYLNSIIVIPLTSTDYTEAAPATAPAPAPATPPAPAPPSPDL